MTDLYRILDCTTERHRLSVRRWMERGEHIHLARGVLLSPQLLSRDGVVSMVFVIDQPVRGEGRRSVSTRPLATQWVASARVAVVPRAIKLDRNGHPQRVLMEFTCSAEQLAEAL